MRSASSYSAAIVVLLTATTMRTEAFGVDRNATYESHLRVVVQEGLLKRGGLSQINRHAAIARRLRPRDPVVDYAVGLALLKRLKHDRAAASFRKALRIDPTYIPAWNALFRVRLDRKDKALFVDAGKLATHTVSAGVAWNGSGRREAAEFLGRLCEFLVLPDVNLFPGRDASREIGKIEKQLGLKFEVPFQAGRSQLRKDYESLRANVEKTAIKRTIDRRKKADAKIDDNKGKRKKNEDKSKTLRKTAAQWKTWLDARQKETDKQLTSLQKDYQTLQTADARVARLVRRTNIDIGRLKTEYRLRGLRGRVAATQPALLRLERESTRYQNQRLGLQRRAARVRAGARRAIAARSVAVAQYQNATGTLVREDARLKRWNQVLRNSSGKAQKRATTTDVGLKSQLTRAAGYFPLDIKAEAARLLGKKSKVESRKSKVES